MAKALVIVESPAKAKTINKYLGKQYVVKASLGHIKDLPKKDLSVDVDNGFEPHYEVIEGKKKLLVELRLIVEREREIRAFQKQEYWTIDVDLAAKKPPAFDARLTKRNEETPTVNNQQLADEIVADLEGAEYTVKSVGTREKRRNPVAPF